MTIIEYAPFAAKHLARAREFVAQHGDDELAHALAAAWGDLDLALEHPAEATVFFKGD